MEKFKDELKTLRKQLQTADNFSSIMHYFFDHMAENPDFHKLGKRSKNKLLKTVLTSVGEKIHGEGAKLTNLLLLELKPYRFFHGACLVNGHSMNVIYFAGIDMGLAACPNAISPGRTEYVRFTCHQVETDEGAILHPGNRTVN